MKADIGPIQLPAVYEDKLVMMRVSRSSNGVFPAGRCTCLVTAVVDALKNTRNIYPLGDFFVVHMNGKPLFSGKTN